MLIDIPDDWSHEDARLEREWDAARMLPLAARMAGNGATRDEIAQAFGVTKRLFDEWATEHDELQQALKMGESYAVARVEDAVFRSAVGYELETEKVFHHKGGIVRAATRDYVRPDMTAAKFWLTNRDPERWADKQRVETDDDYGARLREARAKLEKG